MEEGSGVTFNWPDSEKLRLRRSVEEARGRHDQIDWYWVSTLMGRSVKACQAVFRKIKQEGKITRKKNAKRWQPDELERFNDAVRSIGKTPEEIGPARYWELLSRRVKSRTPDDCRKKWKRTWVNIQIEEAEQQEERNRIRRLQRQQQNAAGGGKVKRPRHT